MSPNNRKQSKKAKPSASSTSSNMPTPIESDSTKPVTIPKILFDFDFFIQNANIVTIYDFLAAVSSTTDGKNLKLLWKHAYEEGRNHGLDEEC